MQSTEIIFALVIFLMILFVYIHINTHFKTSSNMEIYEYSYTTNTQLQEICDLKQPVLFNFVNCVPEMFQIPRGLLSHESAGVNHKWVKGTKWFHTKKAGV